METRRCITKLCHDPKSNLTDCMLFLAAVGAVITGAESELKKYIELQAAGNVVAINTNFSHNSIPGHEHQIKHPKQKKVRRKPQGDGTCFNSSIEPIVKTYYGFRKVRCFPSGGCIQVPGCHDIYMRDASLALFELIRLLTDQKLNKDGHEIKILKFKPELQNFKYSIILKSQWRVNIKYIARLVESDNYVLGINASLIKLENTIVSISIENNSKKNSVLEIFRSGKILMLGNNKTADVYVVYNAISGLIEKDENMIYELPVEDDII